MKIFFKQWMIVFGMVVISAFVIPAFFNGYWEIANFIFKLLIATFTICLLNVVLDKLSIEFPIIKHLIRMCIILAVVYGYGWIWKWYTPDYFWIILVMVLPVYVIYYLIETMKVERDVDMINKQIYARKKQCQEKENDN